MVETALVLPLLILIVFGITEFGRAMFMTNTLNNAAREGARRAVVKSSPLDIANLKKDIENVIPFDKSELSIEITPMAPTTGNPVQVTLTLPFHTVVSGLLPMLDNLPLKGKASMRYEM